MYIATVVKQRDDEAGLEVCYQMHPVEIGVRKNGKPITRVVAIAAERSTTEERPGSMMEILVRE
jgi:hypothetical protein